MIILSLYPQRLRWASILRNAAGFGPCSCDTPLTCCTVTLSYHLPSSSEKPLKRSESRAASLCERAGVCVPWPGTAALSHQNVVSITVSPSLPPLVSPTAPSSKDTPDQTAWVWSLTLRESEGLPCTWEEVTWILPSAHCLTQLKGCVLLYKYTEKV